MSSLPNDPPLGGTIGVIRSLLPSLGSSEGRVAQEVVDRPDEVAMLSVADLARRTDTSSATVIRTCQSLGFKGFQHLRLLLLRDLGSAARSGDRVVTGEGSRNRVPSLFAAAANDLRDALGALDYDTFDGAVGAIAGARRVLIVANGGSGPAAQMLALRFLTADRPCEAPYDSITQQLSARLLHADDVCIAVSDSGMNSTTLRAAEAAEAAGATIVGVTSYARSRLSEISAHPLVVGAAFHSWGEGAVTGNVAQLLILCALQDAVAQLMNNTTATAPAVMNEVMGIVEAPDAASDTVG
jgi:DNA-binding MurR/RpiR family transcriptional regulator